ncbi:HAD family hydrolase [Lysobacter sp. BMK333-48F3]|uniref:HAD family hydrolase n=1 Tax=Lysobacter sp. BMK333-48F3 TaxID=2867962 RepID=UPI001C8B54FA|nr:HAD family hydrolase [Lysobacter sp. BMK333-48F3]MBX9400229.1 HAD family hydrolase [Lysobacter sp. BMK333-48F3]
MLELVGFDGDDTLWHSEGYYQEAAVEFERILGAWVDIGNAAIRERLYAVERNNLALFGYGVKGMVLSMIEAAIDITQARISAADIHRIVVLAKDMLDHPVELLPGIREAVEAVAREHRIVLITKGDLFHQEKKVALSGLADLFHRIEIVSEKDEASYSRVLAEFGVAPERFAMVGNSLRSDIEPVVALGGWGVHMPYHVTWAHEMEHGMNQEHPRLQTVAGADAVAEAIARFHRTA